MTETTSVEPLIEAIQADQLVPGTDEAIDELLVCVTTGFILLMQLGFALVENGSVRAKNSMNILQKNLFDLCLGVVIYWLVGFGLAFGQTAEGGFAGTNGAFYASSNFNSLADGNPYSTFIFQFSFACTAATIVSGALAERTQLPAYIVFSVLMTGFIYPIVVSWTWGGGWLGDGGETTLGFHDFAGTGIVHMVGGAAAIAGALIVGPRHGKEKNPAHRKNVKLDRSYAKLSSFGNAEELEDYITEVAGDQSFTPNSFPFVVYGTIILFVSWLWFNGGSTGGMFNARANGISKIMMVTMISGCAGGTMSTFVKPIIMGEQNRNKKYDVAATCNGILAGLVAITGVCDRVDPWAAFVIGILSAFVYSGSCRLLKVLDIDDPVEAGPVHGITGFFGLICVGIFDNELGLVSGAEGSGSYLGWEILGGIIIFAWSFILNGLFFFIMKKLGLLRVSLLEEVIGLDAAEHGGAVNYKKIQADIVKSTTLRNPSFSNLNAKTNDQKVAPLEIESQRNDLKNEA